MNPYYAEDCSFIVVDETTLTTQMTDIRDKSVKYQQELYY
jgi:hypothetical protein